MVDILIMWGNKFFFIFFVHKRGSYLSFSDEFTEAQPVQHRQKTPTPFLSPSLFWTTDPRSPLLSYSLSRPNPHLLRLRWNSVILITHLYKLNLIILDTFVEWTNFSTHSECYLLVREHLSLISIFFTLFYSLTDLVVVLLFWILMILTVEVYVLLFINNSFVLSSYFQYFD